MEYVQDDDDKLMILELGLKDDTKLLNLLEDKLWTHENAVFNYLFSSKHFQHS